mmetsp:Transcript_53018/g.141727  ORF Transcript_53018/g.141727 Transcript_53018/m.141727 type:complete len:243 (+) Transcript_53018:1627-2355(+)
MTVISHLSLQLHGHVLHRIPLQVVCIPGIVTTREKVLAIHCNNLRVVPTHILAPGTHPHANVRIVWHLAPRVIEKSLTESVVVCGNSNDVTSKNTDRNFVATVGNGLDPLRYFGKELAIWWSQAGEIDPTLGPGNDLSHSLGQAIGVGHLVLISDVVGRVEVHPWRGLSEVADNLSMSHVPTDALIHRVFGLQTHHHSLTNVRQALRDIKLLVRTGLAAFAVLLHSEFVRHGFAKNWQSQHS